MNWGAHWAGGCPRWCPWVPQQFCGGHAPTTSVDMLWQNGVGGCDMSPTFGVPMGAKKVFRCFSAMGCRWDVKQDLADIKVVCANAANGDMVHMEARHLVKISFGNGHARTEPWMTRCFRHANVAEVAEWVLALEPCDSDVFSHPLNSGLKVPKSMLRRPLEFLAGGSLHGNEPRLDQLLLGDLRMSATSDT